MTAAVEDLAEVFHPGGLEGLVDAIDKFTRRVVREELAELVASTGQHEEPNDAYRNAFWPFEMGDTFHYQSSSSAPHWWHVYSLGDDPQRNFGYIGLQCTDQENGSDIPGTMIEQPGRLREHATHLKHQRDHRGITVQELIKWLTGYRRDAKVVMTVKERHGSGYKAEHPPVEVTAPVRVVHVHGDRVELY